MAAASFDAVVSANYDAVALLRCGHLEASATLLREAAASIHLITGTPTVPVSAPHSQEKPLDEIEKKYCVVSVPVDDSHLSTACAATQKSSSPVFTHGFLLQMVGGTASSSLSHTDRNAALCASLCLYNMALMKHLQGLSHGASSCLQKAVGLYKKVFSILSSLSPSPADHFCNLLLATVVNLIACENELYGGTANTQEWKNIYNHMFHYVTSFSASSSTGDDEEDEEQSSAMNPLFEHPEDLAFFTASAVFFANQNLTSAPAA